MNILLLSPTYRPRSGGLETYVEALAKELAKQGNIVSLLTNRDAETQPIHEHTDGIHILRTSELLDGKGWNNYVPWERAYFSLLTDVHQLINPSNFDIIHCHTQVSLLLCFLSGIGYKIPSIASFHETTPYQDALGEQRTRFILRSCPAKKYIVGSQYFQKQAIKFGISEEKIEVIKMGITPPKLIEYNLARKKLYEQFKIPIHKVMITLIGRYTSRKQHERLLKAHAKMSLKNEVVLVFLGSTNSININYLSFLKKELRNYQTESIFLLENLSDEWKNTVISGTDIATQPSSSEGLGLATIEFMMAKTPVIVSDIIGLREAVQYNEEALVDTKESELYAKRLDRLASSPTLRSNQGNILNRIAYSCFSISCSAEKTLEVYSQYHGV